MVLRIISTVIYPEAVEPRQIEGNDPVNMLWQL